MKSDYSGRVVGDREAADPAVEGAAAGWGSSLPPDPDHPVRRQPAFPLVHLLHDSQRLRQQLQAALDAVQTERAASREQAVAATSGPGVRPAPAATAAQPGDVSDTADEPRQDGTQSGSPAAPDSQTSGVPEKAPAAKLASASGLPVLTGSVNTLPSGSTASLQGLGARQALEDVPRQGAGQPEPAPPAPAGETGELPLWTGPDAPPADTAAPESTAGFLDVRAEFQAVVEAWQEHVPPKSGTAQDLVAELDADLSTLQRFLTDTVASPPTSPEMPAAPAGAAEPTAEAGASPAP